MDEQLDPTVLNRMKFDERYAFEQQVLQDLIARYPRELAPYERLDTLSLYVPGERDTLRAEWVKQAKDHPDDPLALLLAGKILENKDSPEAVRLLDSAKLKAPQFPWPARELAWFYMNGKLADPAKVKENLEAYFALCPASASSHFSERLLLQRDPPLLAKNAVALRARLSHDTDPKRLQDYEILWSREFLSRPPKEHDAERALIVQDLKRLETLNPQGDAAWRALLISGYRQSGASAETLTTLENSLIRDFPHSLQADNIVNERWNDAHPQPTGQNDAAAWARYYSEKEDAVRRWMRDYPDDTFLQRCDLFDLAKEDDAISEKDGIAALDIYLQALKDYKNRGMWMYEEYEPAELLLDHGWQTERALELLKETPTIKGNGHLPLNLGDNLSKSDETRFDSFRTEEDQHTIGLLLKAAILTDEPEEAMKLRAAIESQLPADKKLQSEYWWNRARFETLQKHTHQALADYRLALDSRTETPQPNHGRVQDQLTDEAHALFIAQGGTEGDWTAWTESRHKATEATASSEWKKPTDPMPSFELSDFSGRIWRLKDLAGKTVLVSAWATWCGPCRLELVFLENFYERVKDRSDIQVLTLNIDEDPGLVQPFMRQKGYTFPVLSAASLDEIRHLVPRTWVVNSRGAWLWVKDGFDDQKSEAQFDKDLLDRIDAVNSGK